MQLVAPWFNHREAQNASLIYLSLAEWISAI
jgi:hypothetical protein